MTWSIEPQGQGARGYWIYDERGYIALSLTRDDPVVDLAHARRIAAAPALLEALRNAVLQIEYLHEKFQETGSGNTIIARSRAAIAAATGETK